MALAAEKEVAAKLQEVERLIQKNLGKVEVTSCVLEQTLRKVHARCYWRSRQQKKRHKNKNVQTGTCPILLSKFTDMAKVVVASDGYVYDKSALQSWLQVSHQSPMTRELLTPVVPLYKCKRALERLGDF